MYGTTDYALVWGFFCVFMSKLCTLPFTHVGVVAVCLADAVGHVRVSQCTLTWTRRHWTTMQRESASRPR